MVRVTLRCMSANDEAWFTYETSPDQLAKRTYPKRRINTLMRVDLLDRKRHEDCRCAKTVFLRTRRAARLNDSRSKCSPHRKTSRACSVRAKNGDHPIQTLHLRI